MSPQEFEQYWDEQEPTKSQEKTKTDKLKK
jgi:hypothetical protein